MRRRILSLFLSLCLLIGAAPAFAVSGGYSDVPAGDWSEAYIEKATQLGIMSGYGDGRFGHGDKVTRAQFVAMLVRLFGWEIIRPEVAAFSDNTDRDVWYYAEIETALLGGAILADTAEFLRRPI